MEERQPTKIIGFEHLELRVRDLEASVRFYCDVFGLQRQETSPRREDKCVCVGVPASGCGLFGVVLAEGFPAGAELAGLDHVGMSVSTEQDVRDIYARARELGHRATNPRVLNGHYQAFLFDPDGYKLEVFTERSPETARSEDHVDSTDRGVDDAFNPDRYWPEHDSARSW